MDPPRELQTTRTRIMAGRGTIVLVAFGVSVLTQVALSRPSLPPQPERLVSDAPPPTWRRRRRRGVKGMRARGGGLVDLERWPPEPQSPHAVDSNQFGRALRKLCGWMPKRRQREYANWILQYSRQFHVDPFLLASTIYRQSLCIPHESSDYGIGLGRINLGVHANAIRKRIYTYWVLRNGSWVKNRLPLKEFLFYPGNLKRAKPNIYFTAAFLSIYEEQCPDIDGAFGSIRHRHAVSHLIWGDRVLDAGPEDRILRARRRLIEYYTGRRVDHIAKWHNLPLTSPLDGAPRKVTSGMGDDRSDNTRRHRGIDFASTYGEPVRAVASGKVLFVGIDAIVGPSRHLTLEQARHVPKEKLGPGGFYVVVGHTGGLRTFYMHLSEYTVNRGQQVTAGMFIGRVGRTGIHESTAHLHFEMRAEGKHLDPLAYFSEPYVFGPHATYKGRRLAYERWRLRKRKRYGRR